MKTLNFKEDTVHKAMLKDMRNGTDGPHAWQTARRTADTISVLLKFELSAEFWDWLKAEAGIDPQAACCPICGGTTPPAEHTTCLQQLGEWPAKGTRYNDDV